MNLTDLSSAQLRRAASIKERITALEKELGRILGTAPQGGDGSTPKRKMSSVARRRIGAAQKARWSKVKGKKPLVQRAPGRRKMSAAAKARLAAIARERWAKVKASGKKRL